MVDPGTLPTDGEAGAGSPEPVLFPTFDSLLDFLDTGNAGETRWKRAPFSQTVHAPRHDSQNLTRVVGRSLEGCNERAILSFLEDSFPVLC